jgi:ATP-dependent RNA helicase RhlE
VNFDVPHMPEDYIHRVGRTARAEATGEAFTLVAPDEEGDLRQIEKAIGRKLPRRTLPDFNYKHVPQERLEIPLAERIAAIRARKAEDRARAKAKLERREAARGARRRGRAVAVARAGGLVARAVGQRALAVALAAGAAGPARPTREAAMAPGVVRAAAARGGGEVEAAEGAARVAAAAARANELRVCFVGRIGAATGVAR